MSIRLKRAGGVFSGQKQRIGIADHAEVRERWIGVGTGENEISGRVVGRDGLIGCVILLGGWGQMRILFDSRMRNRMGYIEALG